MYWLLGKNSQLELKTKFLLYKSILKPIWLYGCQFWRTDSEFNLSKIQRAQSKILRVISNTPWYITNERLHIDLDVPSVREVISNQLIKHKRKLENHTNILAIVLDNSETIRRRKKFHVLDSEDRMLTFNWKNKFIREVITG